MCRRGVVAVVMAAAEAVVMTVVVVMAAAEAVLMAVVVVAIWGRQRWGSC